MQKDPIAEMNSGDRPYPHRAPKILHHPETRRWRTNTPMAADGDEEPSEAGEIRVYRSSYREKSRLILFVRVWKIVDLGVNFDVHGPRAWLPQYSFLIALLAAASAIVPVVLLPSSAAEGAKIVIAVGSATIVALTGCLVMRYCVRRSRKTRAER